MKKVMFCGGGSAGHVMPNIALCEDLKERYDICYMGTGGIEKNICQNYNIPFFEFSTPKLVRGKIFCNLAIPFKLLKSIRQTKRILMEQKPDLLFCKGGYVSVPAAKSANALGIPVITHESDISAGVANKLIAKYCNKVLTSFPQTAKKFKNGKFVGVPLRSCIFKQNPVEARQFFGLDMRPTLLVFGGGSGSQIINTNIRKIVPTLCKTYNVLHVCGKGNAVASNVYGYKQIEFISNMGLAYACANAAIARCGANSAMELTALKVPTLFIPLGNKRSRGDQIKNAEFFKNLGTCQVLGEDELTAQTLLCEIEKLFKNNDIINALKTTQIRSGNAKIEEEIKSALTN